MKLNIQGKQMDIGESLSAHIQQKLDELNSKFFNRAISASVTLTPEGHSFFKAHVKVGIGKDIDVEATAVEAEPYQAFDSAAEKIAKQMRRYKRRLRDHRQRIEDLPEVEGVEARNYVVSLEEESADENVPTQDEPVIIAEMSAKLQKLSVSEAVMRMDLSGQPALLFRNLKDDTISMVYRREDGNIGWVDTGEASKKPESGESLAAE